MDLVRHLRFFVAVAEEGHFGHAADRLQMTQPPVSQGLRRLEGELGVELIRRTSRGAELTAAGRELLPRARLLVDDAARFHSEARRLRSGSDVVRVGMPTNLGVGAVARCAEALRSHRPDDGFQITSGLDIDLVDAVRARSLDIAIVEHPCVLGDMTGGPIIRIARTFLVPATHALASATRPTTRMFAGLTLCHPPRTANPAAFDLLTDTLHERGIDAQTTVARSDTELIAAVAGGGSFSLVTEPDRYASIPGVRCVPMLADDIALRLRVVRDTDEFASDAQVLESVLWKHGR